MQTTKQQQDAQVTRTTVPKLVTSQDQIMYEYPDVLREVSRATLPYSCRPKCNT